MTSLGAMVSVRSQDSSDTLPALIGETCEVIDQKMPQIYCQITEKILLQGAVFRPHSGPVGGGKPSLNWVCKRRSKPKKKKKPEVTNVNSGGSCNDRLLASRSLVSFRLHSDRDCKLC